MVGAARENSVRNLQNLYTVVVGLALSLGLVKVVDVAKQPWPLRMDLLPYFFAFVCTVIPFYHGALRHLDFTYIEESGRHTRSGALMLDFLLLFAEGCGFLACAALLSAPSAFAWGLAVILLLDALWGLVAHVAMSSKAGIQAEKRWAVLNLLAFGVLTLFHLLAWGCGSAEAYRVCLMVGVPAICLVRSSLDYAMCWAFYYPSAPDYQESR